MKFFGNGTPGKKKTHTLFFNSQAMPVCLESHYNPGEMKSVSTAHLCHCTGFIKMGWETATGSHELLTCHFPRLKKISITALKEETWIASPHLPVSPASPALVQPFQVLQSCLKDRGPGFGCSEATQDLTNALRSHHGCFHAPASACPAHMYMAFPPLAAAPHRKFIFSW